MLEVAGPRLTAIVDFLADLLGRTAIILGRSMTHTTP